MATSGKSDANVALAGLSAFSPVGSGFLAAQSELTKARGQATAYQFKEAQAQRQQQAVATAADQTDAQLRDKLSVTLGNITAIRASSGVDPTSPTSLALMDREAAVSDNARTIQVGNLKSQEAQSASDASYYQWAADQALSTGDLAAGAAGANAFLSSLKRFSPGPG